MKHETFSLTTSDGINIFGQQWLPEEQPKAVICLVHGMGEHSSRYEHVARYFTGQGYAVVAIDHRGHGKSGGKRGHTPDLDAMLDGLELLINHVEKEFPGLPKFLYGHSLGGNLVLNYVLRRKPPVSGLIVTGPWLKLAFEPPAFKVKLARWMKNLFPSFSQSTKLDTKAISRDKEVVKAYEKDPLVHDKISASAFFNFYESGLWALKNADKLDIPMLLMHGTDDRLTSEAASRQFASAAPTDTVEYIPWEGLYHELHNEPEKEKVLKVISEWIEEHLNEPEEMEKEKEIQTRKRTDNQ